MRRAQDISKEKDAMSMLVKLTGVFEGLASMRISQVKNQVLKSQEFFDELWGIYTKIRVDSLFRFGRSESSKPVINKELLIIITAEGGFSGDIDQKLISLMLKTYDKNQHEIIVVGHHGAVQLAQRGISYKKYFKLPEKDQNINTAPIIQEVQQYASTTIFYQTYVSLMVQDVKRISLKAAVEQKGKTAAKLEDMITEETYIFEPSTFAVVDHLERSMLQIAVSQVILESKLAQYASRFRAMTQSNSKATELYEQVEVSYRRALRGTKDERLKEIVNGLRNAGASV